MRVRCHSNPLKTAAAQRSRQRPGRGDGQLPASSSPGQRTGLGDQGPHQQGQWWRNPRCHQCWWRLWSALRRCRRRPEPAPLGGRGEHRGHLHWTARPWRTHSSVPAGRQECSNGYETTSLLHCYLLNSPIPAGTRREPGMSGCPIRPPTTFGLGSSTAKGSEVRSAPSVWLSLRSHARSSPNCHPHFRCRRSGQPRLVRVCCDGNRRSHM